MFKLAINHQLMFIILPNLAYWSLNHCQKYTTAYQYSVNTTHSRNSRLSNTASATGRWVANIRVLTPSLTPTPPGAKIAKKPTVIETVFANIISRSVSVEKVAGKKARYIP